MGPVLMLSINVVTFQVADQYTLHKNNENTHLWEIYFPRDPKESFKNESVQTNLFNIEMISPKDLEANL